VSRQSGGPIAFIRIAQVGYNQASDFMEHVFVVPISDNWLVHAPLHRISLLANSAAVDCIKKGVFPKGSDQYPGLDQLLHASPPSIPGPATGPIQPEFLGLIPTRACNMACVYCGFGASDSGEKTLDPAMAAKAVDWMAQFASRNGRSTLDIHFFGGEPFRAPETVDVAIHYARARAAELGLIPRFEVATNGYFPAERCRFIGSYFDTVVLSFDGPKEIQNRHRPLKDGRGTYPVVARNIKTLSQSPAELSIRTCVTQETVGTLDRITRWFCEKFAPDSIVFEPLQPVGRGETRNFVPPDPWNFSAMLMRSASIGAACGVKVIYPPASIDTLRHSFCPVGRDSLILSPDGHISGCYLLEEDWRKRGLDLNLGRLHENGSMQIDMAAVERIRDLSSHSPRCRRCLARWHCAGGCRVNHSYPGCPDGYDAFCIQTRIITACRLLEGLGCHEEVERLLERRSQLERLVFRRSDRLPDWQG
jgi:uncharacterized protein